MGQTANPGLETLFVTSNNIAADIDPACDGKQIRATFVWAITIYDKSRDRCVPHSSARDHHRHRSILVGSDGSGPYRIVRVVTRHYDSGNRPITYLQSNIPLGPNQTWTHNDHKIGCVNGPKDQVDVAIDVDTLLNGFKLDASVPLA